MSPAFSYDMLYERLREVLIRQIMVGQRLRERLHSLHCWRLSHFLHRNKWDSTCQTCWYGVTCLGLALLVVSNVSRWSPCRQWIPTLWGCSVKHQNCRLWLEQILPLWRVVVGQTVFRHCRGSLEEEQLIIRTIHKVVMRVLTVFLLKYTPSAIWRWVGSF